MKSIFIKILPLLLLLLLFTSCATIKKHESTLCNVGQALCASLTYICAKPELQKQNHGNLEQTIKLLKSVNDSLKIWYDIK